MVESYSPARLGEESRDEAHRPLDIAPLALRAGLNVLDVGCGTGEFIRLLAPIVSPGTAVGVDLSETMIAEACQRSAENVDNLSFRVGSVLELPFPVASFDRVLATSPCACGPVAPARAMDRRPQQRKRRSRNTRVVSRCS